MREDLQSLEITKGELRHLSGVDAEELFRPSLLRNKSQLLAFLCNEALIGLALTPIIAGIIYIFMLKPLGIDSIALIILLLIILPIAIITSRWLWLKHSTPKLLISLLDDIDRYHAVIKAIDINDQLETAGTPGSSLTDRTQVLQVLRLTREELVRALMGERILRENKISLATNPDLFINNLASLKTIQVNSEAGEYGRLLNEALQISISVQAEMRKLLHQRSN